MYGIYKSQTFLWRVIRDYLPVRDTLQRKGIPVPLTCAHCDGRIENTWHSFFAMLFCSRMLEGIPSLPYYKLVCSSGGQFCRNDIFDDEYINEYESWEVCYDHVGLMETKK